MRMWSAETETLTIFRSDGTIVTRPMLKRLGLKTVSMGRYAKHDVHWSDHFKRGQRRRKGDFLGTTVPIEKLDHKVLPFLQRQELLRRLRCHKYLCYQESRFFLEASLEMNKCLHFLASPSFARYKGTDSRKQEPASALMHM